jgi:tRNA1Val (adenine37-N6)-methyltransferase
MFKFKHFNIEDKNAAMKVGTDAVLLGAWVTIRKTCNSILDIGAGTGIIAMQMAQRSNAEQIDAVEVDENAYEQTVENFENSDWGDRLFCYHASFTQLVNELEGEEFYDLIICNPPFYAEDYKTKTLQRNQARFQDALPFKDLIAGAYKLLSPKGQFSVIIPYSEEDKFVELAKEHKLHTEHITRVKGHKTAPIKRSLISLSFNKVEKIEDKLVIEVSRHNYTEAYKNLVKDFYLKL